jgi:hypothetical protein
VAVEGLILALHMLQEPLELVAAEVFDGSHVPALERLREIAELVLVPLDSPGGFVLGPKVEQPRIDSR